MKYLLLTGMSGAGKTLALRSLEDLGAFCVDNLPAGMIPGLMESCESTAMAAQAAAFSVDVRSGASFNAWQVSQTLRDAQDTGHGVQILFLEASDEVLLSRFKESRREHPLCADGITLTEAIALERARLQPLREAADYLVDTSNLRPRGLQSRMAEILQELTGGREPPLRVEVESFGFKRGLPRGADLVLDVRFLPNPFYIAELCRHSGLEAPVRDFVLGHPVTQTFLEKEEDMLAYLLPHYREEGKRRLVIAVGCTGGAHRSVAIAEALADWLEKQGYRVERNHRDVELEQARWLVREEKEETP
ncbi:MAG: RNase adapter RapZ [Clostridia bacterium]|nr:RNase adapter RapZ [Clostridia bacterium]